MKATLAGWQVAGIVNIASGPPIPRLQVDTNGFRRGNRADQVGDPRAGELDFPLWFDPTAFVPPADGTFGNSPRAAFRQPGRHQWDLTFSKNWRPTGDIRLQFRAELINAFNHTQWLGDSVANGLDNTCTASVTSCVVASDRFGQIIAVRAPREIQFGLKLYW